MGMCSSLLASMVRFGYSAQGDVALRGVGGGGENEIYLNPCFCFNESAIFLICN